MARAAVKVSYAALGLTAADLKDMHYKMVLTRVLDERLWTLNRQGKVVFVVTGRGHEAAQVGSAYAMRRGEDFFLPYYRDLGVVVALGLAPREVMLGFFARAADPCSGGRQMPSHWSYPPLKIVSGSSPVATQIPHAVGVALAAKIRGQRAVAIVYFGEGCTSQGDFHEGLNFAGVHKLPVIFFCENNQYAISEAQSKEMAVENVADRAAAYGFPGVLVDGNDLLAVYRVTQAAAERARRGEGPTLIEAKTYRTVPHTSDDDDRAYRSREEVEEWKRRDPIDRFRNYLEQQGLWAAELERKIREQAAQEVEDAVAFAEQSPYPSPEDMLTHVYFEEGKPWR